MIAYIMVYWISMYASVSVDGIATEAECRRVAFEFAKNFNPDRSDESNKETAERRGTCIQYEMKYG